MLSYKLFTNICNSCSFLKIRDRVSHPYNKTGKVTLLYFPIFSGLETRRGYDSFRNE
jgi:hypothetical protein